MMRALLPAPAGARMNNLTNPLRNAIGDRAGPDWKQVSTDLLGGLALVPTSASHASSSLSAALSFRCPR